MYYVINIIFIHLSVRLLKIYHIIFYILRLLYINTRPQSLTASLYFLTYLFRKYRLPIDVFLSFYR